MLNEIEPEKILEKVPQLEDRAKAVSRGIHQWVLDGGKQRRKAVDVLHGTWLGHPLHPVLTDVTIGAWVFGFVLDLLNLGSRSKGVQQAADTLLDIGNVSATATALAGIADYSTIPQRAMKSGAIHALLNTAGLGLNILSSILRKKEDRGAAILLSAFASSLLMASAWLGGEIVYKYKVGINKTPKEPKPGKWHATQVLDLDLREMTPQRVEVEGSPILLYRYQGQVYAIGAVCGHEGGPLDEGSFEEHCVTCPWHQSVFDLRDGSVVHGPATYAVPSYEVRVQQGAIEVRVIEKTVNEEAARLVHNRL